MKRMAAVAGIGLLSLAIAIGLSIFWATSLHNHDLAVVMSFGTGIVMGIIGISLMMTAWFAMEA